MTETELLKASAEFEKIHDAVKNASDHFASMMKEFGLDNPTMVKMLYLYKQGMLANRHEVSAALILWVAHNPSLVQDFIEEEVRTCNLGKVAEKADSA